MRWFDMGAFGLLVVVLVGIGLALFLIVTELWSSVRPRVPKPRREAETELGPFVNYGHAWIGYNLRDTHLVVTTDDRDGMPDPGFLRRVPDILQAIDEFERRARGFEPVLDARGFDLSGIRQRTPEGEWSLEFAHHGDEDLEWAVEFADGHPVRACEI